MPANFEKGFVVREPAWHGLAVVLDHYPGREEAMKLAGHDFNVIELPVLVATPLEVGGVVVAQQNVEAKGWKALLREDTMAIIAVVKDSYEIIQNAQIWDILDALLDQPDVQYETGGTLRGGAQVWALARFKEPLHVSGDDSDIRTFLNVSTTHDGTGAAKAFPTNIRTVCENTMSAGLTEAAQAGLIYTFRHTKNVKDRIEFARSAIGMAKREANVFLEIAEELAAQTVTYTQVRDFLTRFIPAPPEVLTTDRVKANIEEARVQVLDCLDNSPSVAQNHRRTAYGLLCAGSEYLDHLRTYRTEETHFRRCIMDTSRAKNQLLTIIKDVVA
jgi:phage/plasmid-like protein (TIGR03299 family)